MNFLELCGLMATFIVFVSFLPKNIVVIRWANLVGSIFFVIYGFGIGAIWTGTLNAGLILVHAYHLVKIYLGKKNKKSKKNKKVKKH